MSISSGIGHTEIPAYGWRNSGQIEIMAAGFATYVTGKQEKMGFNAVWFPPYEP